MIVGVLGDLGEPDHLLGVDALPVNDGGDFAVGPAGVKADAAVRLYLGGETPIPDICAATGVSKSTLYRILRERGLVGVRK